MEYGDFVIQILPGPDASHEVRVQSPDGREGKGSFEIPASLERLSWGRSPADFRDLSPPQNGTAQAFPSAREAGAQLFRALFTGQVRDLFVGSLAALRNGPGQGLRIRLWIDHGLGKAQSLPWELIRIPETDDWLSLSRRTVVVRSLGVPRPVDAAPLARRLRILALACCPAGYPLLDLESECRHLESEVGWGWPLEVEVLKNAGREELRAVLLDNLKTPFHILHFMGHGDFDARSGNGTLLFETPEGRPQPVTGEELATELKDFSSLRLVVLNACQTARMPERPDLDPFAGVASALLLGGVPAVLGMRTRVSDRTATTFSKALYRRLAAGDPVDTAVAEGRMAVHQQEGEEGGWSIPVLFLRGRDGRLFQIERSRLWKRIAAAVLTAALVLGGLLWKGLGQPALEDASAASRLDALTQNNEGISLVSEGKLSEAREAFLAALREDPGFAVSHANLAALEERAGNYEEALAHARAAVAAAPRQAVYHYNLGILLSRLGRAEEAFAALRHATAIEPCYFKAYNELGNLWLDLDRPADARRAIEMGIRCGPDFAPLYKNLGRAALSQGKLAEAVQNLEKALRFPSQDQQGRAETLYWLALAQARLHRGEAACERLEQLRGLAIPVFRFSAEVTTLTQQLRCDGGF